MRATLQRGGAGVFTFDVQVDAGQTFWGSNGTQAQEYAFYCQTA